MLRLTLSAVLCLALLSGCNAGRTQRVDLDAELVRDSQGTSVQDYRTVADKMARSLIQLPFIHTAKTPPTIAFVSVENRSNQYIDTKAFQEKIRTNLLRNCAGKLYFLDRTSLAAIQQERQLKGSGEFSSKKSGKEKIIGADYFLTGSIHSINKLSGTGKTEYMRYAFRLTDANNSLIVWEDEYETRYHKQTSWLDQ